MYENEKGMAPTHWQEEIKVLSTSSPGLEMTVNVSPIRLVQASIVVYYAHLMMNGEHVPFCALKLTGCNQDCRIID